MEIKERVSIACIVEKRERDLFTALMKADEMAGNISQ